jgi:hypothetical protein
LVAVGRDQDVLPPTTRDSRDAASFAWCGTLISDDVSWRRLAEREGKSVRPSVDNRGISATALEQRVE